MRQLHNSKRDLNKDRITVRRSSIVNITRVTPIIFLTWTALQAPPRISNHSQLAPCGHHVITRPSLLQTEANPSAKTIKVQLKQYSLLRIAVTALQTHIQSQNNFTIFVYYYHLNLSTVRNPSADDGSSVASQQQEQQFQSRIPLISKN